MALPRVRVYARRAMRGKRRVVWHLRGPALAVIVLWASGALAAWVVNERGECVRAWTPASLVRGPAAMVNAPLLPLRSAVGGVLVESVIWLGTGLTDTATGGYFEMAPDEATRLGVEPVRPTFIAAAPRPPRESGDRCGRRTGPDAR